MKEEIKLNELFQKAKTSKIEASFEETKEMFLSSKSGQKIDGGKNKSQLFTLKNGLIMLAIVSTIAISLFLIPSEDFSTPKETKTEKIKNVANENRSIEVERKEEQTFSKVPAVKMISKVQMDSIVNELVPFTDVVFEKITSTNELTEHKKPKLVQPFQFPVLTEKEKNDNEKRKKKMVKALSKFDKKAYSYIPSGSFDFHGKKWSVQAFMMQTAEVSNIEYKTFLFDLLIYNRKDEFLIAAPDQTMWTKIGGDMKAMQDNYFSHEAYDNYPVVNVSRQGAEMYCVWLTKEVNKYLKSKNNPLMNDLRLPVRAEWEKAASGTGEFMPFPWGGPYAQNAKGCFLANYNPSKEGLLMDTMNCEGCDKTYSSYSDGAMHTAKTKTYIPNSYGLYNMSGNVAEMVSEGYDYVDGKRIAKEPGTAGGGWLSSFESIKIDGKDEHKGVTTAHPNIGFRVVTSYLNQSK